ncbi:hypothetical protein GQR58_026106 [Nymphon striatum]|nr:hypothetical protein GQR58_026106 [Nymphon striatum]
MKKSSSIEGIKDFIKSSKFYIYLPGEEYLCQNLSQNISDIGGIIMSNLDESNCFVCRQKVLDRRKSNEVTLAASRGFAIMKKSIQNSSISPSKMIQNVKDLKISVCPYEKLNKFILKIKTVKEKMMECKRKHISQDKAKKTIKKHRLKSCFVKYEDFDHKFRPQFKEFKEKGFPLTSCFNKYYASPFDGNINSDKIVQKKHQKKYYCELCKKYYVCIDKHLEERNKAHIELKLSDFEEIDELIDKMCSFTRNDYFHVNTSINSDIVFSENKNVMNKDASGYYSNILGFSDEDNDDNVKLIDALPKAGTNMFSSGELEDYDENPLIKKAMDVLYQDDLYLDSSPLEPFTLKPHCKDYKEPVVNSSSFIDHDFLNSQTILNEHLTTKCHFELSPSCATGFKFNQSFEKVSKPEVVPSLEAKDLTSTNIINNQLKDSRSPSHTSSAFNRPLTPKCSFEFSPSKSNQPSFEKFSKPEVGRSLEAKDLTSTNVLNDSSSPSNTSSVFDKPPTPKCPVELSPSKSNQSFEQISKPEVGSILESKDLTSTNIISNQQKDSNSSSDTSSVFNKPSTPKSPFELSPSKSNQKPEVGPSLESKNLTSTNIISNQLKYSNSSSDTPSVFNKPPALKCSFELSPSKCNQSFETFSKPEVDPSLESKDLTSTNKINNQPKDSSSSSDTSSVFNKPPALKCSFELPLLKCNLSFETFSKPEVDVSLESRDLTSTKKINNQLKDSSSSSNTSSAFDKLPIPTCRHEFSSSSNTKSSQSFEKVNKPEVSPNVEAKNLTLTTLNYEQNGLNSSEISYYTGHESSYSYSNNSEMTSSKISNTSSVNENILNSQQIDEKHYFDSCKSPHIRMTINLSNMTVRNKPKSSSENLSSSSDTQSESEMSPHWNVTNSTGMKLKLMKVKHTNFAKRSCLDFTLVGIFELEVMS